MTRHEKALSPSKGFTLIELLVVMAIIMVLAGFLLVGISAARRAVNRGKTKAEIDNMMMALTAYNNDFAAYPPGGTDTPPGDGVLDELGAGTMPADPLHPTPLELQLRTITVKLTIEGGNRTVGPYYSPNQTQIVKYALVDVFGFSFRYLADGRNPLLDAQGKRLAGRVEKRGPVLWSVGEDGVQDAHNDNIDDDNFDGVTDQRDNGKVDDSAELTNDICSWN